MDTRAKERSLQWPGHQVTTTEWASKRLAPWVVRPEPSAFFHQFSFVPVWPLLPVLLEGASSARLQALAFDSMPWPQFSSSGSASFLFRLGVGIASRASNCLEDLSKSHPTPALNVYQPAQRPYTEWRQFLGGHAPENLLPASGRSNLSRLSELVA